MMSLESARSRQFQRSGFSNQMNLRTTEWSVLSADQYFPQPDAGIQFLRFTSRDDAAFSASSITDAEHRAF